MRDFPPDEKLLRDEVIQLLIDVFQRYGFSPLETPIVERWEVLAAKYAGGEEVLQETFRLVDRGGRELALRYELTTPLARFIGMHPTIKRPFKRYQIGPVFRDGPIKQGRYREFYQCDVDTVGVRSPLADAEFVLLALDVFDRLGFRVEIRVNHRRLLKDLAARAGVPEELQETAILTIDKLEKIGREGVRAELLQKGIAPEGADRWLEILDVAGERAEVLEQIHREVPESEGISQLIEMFAVLPAREEIRFVPSLARGLAYYTGVIYEIYSVDPALDSSVAAGGRWDDLIGNYLGGRQQYPAVGISFGLEPIIELLKGRREGPQRRTVTRVYVIPIALRNEALEIAQALRRAGIPTDLDLAGKGISENLRYANAYEIPHVLLVGPEEHRQGVVKLRDMGSGEEELLPLEEAIARLSA
jgi:histidyl-tRNA synthetase